MTNETNTKIVELVPTALVPVFNAPIQFNVTDAAIAELRVKHNVTPITNTKELKENAASIAVIRTLRVNVDKRRKELKKEANEYGKKVQTEANRITGELESIEQPLNDAKDAYEAKKAAVAAEKKRKEEERVQTIKDKINEIKAYPANFIFKGSNIPQIKKAIERLLFVKDEFDYQEFASEVLQVKTKAIEELKQLQTNREDLEKEEKEAEAKRIELAKQEAELKAERDKLAKERKAIANAQAALQAEKDAVKAKQEAAGKLVKEQTIKQTALLKSTKALHEFDKENLIDETTYTSLFGYHNDHLTDEQKENLAILQEELAKRQESGIEHMRDAAPLMLLTLQNIWNDINAGKTVDMNALEKMIRYGKAHEFASEGGWKNG